VDELNAAIGVAHPSAQHDFVRNNLLVIQKDLIVLMGELCVQAEEFAPLRQGRLFAGHASDDGNARCAGGRNRGAEREFQGLGDAGSDPSGAALDLARTICRRAERRVCSLKDTSELKNAEIVIYLNRLSDLVMAVSRAGWRRSQVPANEMRSGMFGPPPQVQKPDRA